MVLFIIAIALAINIRYKYNQSIIPSVNLNQDTRMMLKQREGKTNLNIHTRLRSRFQLLLCCRDCPCCSLSSCLGLGLGLGLGRGALVRRWGRGIRIRIGVWVCGCNGGGGFSGWHFISSLLFPLGWFAHPRGVAQMLAGSRGVRYETVRREEKTGDGEGEGVDYSCAVVVGEERICVVEVCVGGFPALGADAEPGADFVAQFGHDVWVAGELEEAEGEGSGCGVAAGEEDGDELVAEDSGVAGEAG